ncbi:MAG: DUF126 domain-containing protein [Firmicutes bacterium]|nr:DUF126 domain-containing protein [Bacillota bacterium]
MFECHPICRGVAEGDALVSSDNICFYLTDPTAGKVIEEGHSIEGESVAGKVLVFPGGKGSSVVQADGMYQLAVKGNSPSALIIEYPETVLVASAIIMEVPMVDRVDKEFYRVVKNGDKVKVDAEKGTITVVKAP